MFAAEGYWISVASLNVFIECIVRLNFKMKFVDRITALPVFQGVKIDAAFVYHPSMEIVLLIGANFHMFYVVERLYHIENEFVYGVAATSSDQRVIILSSSG